MENNNLPKESKFESARKRIRQEHGRLALFLVDRFPLLWGAAISGGCRLDESFNYGMLIPPAFFALYDFANPECDIREDTSRIFESFLGGLLPYTDKIYLAAQNFLN